MNRRDLTRRQSSPATPRLEPLLNRGLGVPGLFAAVYSVVGFSIYFSLGVVADRGLGLTPLIFLAAGLLFVLTTLSYVEGGAMIRERGGSSSFARHAFNELIAFIAGWAILIDYLIVAALAAISVPHYLEPISHDLSEPGWEIGVASLVIVAACTLNILNITGRGRARALSVLALADIVLQLAVIGVGALAVLHPDRLTDQLHLFTSPNLKDIVYASVVAMLAYAGIEAASDLAPDIDVRPRDLKRIVSVGAVAVPLVYAGMAAIALMAVPVVAGPQGPETALGHEFVEAPVLGVVSAYHPAWVARHDALDGGAGRRAGPVLGGEDRDARRLPPHLHAGDQPPDPELAGQAQRPLRDAARGDRALRPDRDRPGRRRPTSSCLAGIYAFGATLAITIAHLSILRLRITEPDRRAPLPGALERLLARRAASGADPLRRRGQRPRLPQRARLPRHARAGSAAAGWLFGLLFYVVYRKVFEGTSLTRRVSVTEQALTKQVPEVEYGNILVPVFGTKLDDDIVATAGRLAAAEQEEEADRGRPTWRSSTCSRCR